VNIFQKIGALLGLTAIAPQEAPMFKMGQGRHTKRFTTVRPLPQRERHFRRKAARARRRLNRS
jgi:hypothetical protein